MSTTRDDELDALEQELRGTPFVEKPDDLPITDGSSCFLDKERLCGPDCRAYDIEVDPPQGPQVCTLLTSMMDLGAGIQPFVEIARTLRKQRADKARENASGAAVPDPTGGKR